MNLIYFDFLKPNLKLLDAKSILSALPWLVSKHFSYSGYNRLGFQPLSVLALLGPHMKLNKARAYKQQFMVIHVLINCKLFLHFIIIKCFQELFSQ